MTAPRIDGRRRYLACRAISDDARTRRLYGHPPIGDPAPLVDHLAWLIDAEQDERGELAELVAEHIADLTASW